MSTPSIVFHREEAPGRARAAVSAGLTPDFLLVSTSLFDGQGPDWEYLGPAKSQHVFFSRRRSLAGHDNAVLRAIVEAGEGGAAADRRRS